MGVPISASALKPAPALSTKPPAQSAPEGEAAFKTLPPPSGHDATCAIDAIDDEEEPEAVIGGRYKLTELLGEGGFGVVYRGVQLSTGQTVAVKLLHAELLDDPKFAQEVAARFEREVNVVSTLRHPNIVQLIDKGQLDNGQMYMVLEYIEGESLADLIDERGRLGLRESTRLMIEVLDALHAAHKVGIVHRDLKPGNIMLTSTGHLRHAVVLDFGIAGIVEGKRGVDYRTLTQAAGIRGTPAYMSPEQIKGSKLTPQTDIFAWAMTFLECVLGDQAVQGASPLDVALKQMGDDPVPIPEHLLGAELSAILRRAAEKSTERRYQDAASLLDELVPLENLHSSTGLAAVSSGAATTGDEDEQATLIGIDLDAALRQSEAQNPAPPPAAVPKPPAEPAPKRNKAQQPLALIVTAASLAALLVGLAVGFSLELKTTPAPAPTPESAPEAAHQELAQQLRQGLDASENLALSEKLATLVKQSPDDDDAHALLAYLLAQRYAHGWDNSQRMVSQVREHAEAALRSKNSAEALTALAIVHFGAERDEALAKQRFSAAIEADPFFAADQAALFCNPKGEYEQSRELLQTAAAAGRNPDEIQLGLAELELLQGRPRDALDALEELAQRGTSSSRLSLLLGQSRLALGQAKLAVGHFENARKLDDGGLAQSYLALALIGDEQADKARDLLALLRDRYDQGGRVTATQVARVYAALGEPDESFSWLEKARADHDLALLSLSQDHSFDASRTDPRFDALLQSLHP
jgi:serine/threonine protein kinase